MVHVLQIANEELRSTAMKYIKNNNAPAQPLFCSLNLLFSDIVAVMVFLNSWEQTNVKSVIFLSYGSFSLFSQYSLRIPVVYRTAKKAVLLTI